MEFNATFIASAVSFIIFTLIMNAIFYKPLQKIVTERQSFIDGTLEEAKKHNEKSEAILKDKEKKLEKTKHDAKKIIVEKTDEVKAQKGSLASEAQQKAIKKVESAKEELQKDKEEAQQILTDEVQKLAQSISSKILGKV